MLLRLVERTCAEIGELTLSVLPELKEELLENASDSLELVAQENRRQKRASSVDDAAGAMALLAWTAITSIPRIAAQMMQKLADRRVNSVRRLSIASMLTYLVQPHDLVPDDARAGYGWLDDAILIRAGLVEYLQILPDFAESVESEANRLQLLIALTPASVRPALQQSVATMAIGLQLMSVMEGPVAESMLNQVMNDPLAFRMPSASRGFAPRQTWGAGGYRDQGHFSNGAWFEGNSVIMSGGPSLIDGQLFIPG